MTLEGQQSHEPPETTREEQQQQQQQHALDDPPRKRRRAGGVDTTRKRERCANACNSCKMRKLKCFKDLDNAETCVLCRKSGTTCTFTTNEKKPSTAYVQELESRLAKMEEALLASSQAAALAANQARAATIYPPEPNDERHRFRPSPVLLNASHSSLPAHQAAAVAIPGPNLFMQWVRAGPSHKGFVNFSSIIEPQSVPLTPVNPCPQLPTQEASEAMLDTVYLHVQSRYPFIHWARLRDWLDRREQICFVSPLQAPNSAHPPGPSSDDQIGAFFVWAMYAIAAQLQSTHHALDTPESYFEQATRYLGAVTIANDLTTVQALLFLLFFAFRSSSGPSLWYLRGFIVQLCVDLRLHRRETSRASDDPFQVELDKRVFWSAYSLDRLIALASDRPFGVSDIDIDVDLPVDVDDDVTDAAILRSLQKLQLTGSPPGYAASTTTTMSSAIHSIRLFRLRSHIHQTFYAPRAPLPARETATEFLVQLEEWRVSSPTASSSNYPVQSKSKFQMMYYQAVLYLLRPAVRNDTSNHSILLLCAMAAAEACEECRSVLQTTSAKHTVVTLYHIFSSGMTLLYCLSISSRVISMRVSSRAIRSCSSALAVYAELFPVAVPFRELFEHFADEALDLAQDTAGANGTTVNNLGHVIDRILMGDYRNLHEALNEKSDMSLGSNGRVMTGRQMSIAPPALDAESETISATLVQSSLQSNLQHFSFDDISSLQTFSDFVGLADLFDLSSYSEG